MKILKLFVLLFVISSAVSAQQLSGLWMGELINESSQKKQHFELALSEYRGKITGFSYTTFIENDHYYYSIKRIKAKREDATWTIEDDKMVANNFPEKTAKGVKQTSIFTLNKRDSTWQMNGQWKTNRTKEYYSLKGTLQMDEEKDFSKSQLFPHLEELQPGETVQFNQPEKRLTSMGKMKANKSEVIPAKIPSIVNNGPVKQDVGIVTTTVTPKTSIEKITIEPKTEPVPEIEGRSIEVIRTVLFKSDSLVLALYDNGEIDGDTVSVYLNRELILSKEGLKATAIKKTINLKGIQDSMQLILFAENLGKYPPNTGLLIVRDGEDVYQIRFSANLQRSPAIVFKRKTNE